MKQDEGKRILRHPTRHPQQWTMENEQRHRYNIDPPTSRQAF